MHSHMSHMSPVEATSTARVNGDNGSRTNSDASIANLSDTGLRPLMSSTGLKRWDGARQICTSWDNLGKDPELFTRDGNCLIYLHNYNDVRRGPPPKYAASFRLPFSLLLANNCYALIERSLVRPADNSSRLGRSPGEIQRWYRSNPEQTVELFIPPPQGAHQKQIQRHQLLLRNFFAWMLRRSLVGETLGEAMVGLLECMHEYRSGGAFDNVADLVNYLDEEGYLCLTNQPDHALAILRLAETFLLKTLYLQALTHCVGVGDAIATKLDYQHVSLATRKLVWDAKEELDSRLRKASSLLSNFLDHELSETHLGIPAGVRTHMEHFRSFLLSFYSTKLGYYPPLLFDGCTYRAMARDFQALYNLLVDESYRSSEPMPSVAVGGICTLQLIQSFDSRSGFESLKHPLPKLPHQEQPSRRTRRMSWLPRVPKQRNGDHQVNHASLVKASNWKGDAFDNSLVKAYRNFEEEYALAPRKLDKHEKVSLVDGRKIRWILIYAVHQTLQNATQRPKGVPDDPKATYLVSVARDTKVPWEDNQLPGGLPRSWTEPVLSRLSGLMKQLEAPMPEAAVKKFAIEPDIDYFAITHKEDAPLPAKSRRASMPSDSQVAVQRSSSIKQSFSRSSTLRRSMRRLQRAPSISAPASVSSSKSLYQEIVVHGYGNGINHVCLEPDAMSRPTQSTVLAHRSGSTASETGTGSSNISTVPSWVSMTETLESSLSSTLVAADSSLEMPTYARHRSRRDSNSVTYTTGSSPTLSPPKAVKGRPMSAALDGYYYAAKTLGHIVDNERQGGHTPSRPVVQTDLKRSGSLPQSNSMPLPIQEDDVDKELYVLSRDSGEWSVMQAFLDGKDPDEAGNGESHAWEQYADLGGLTEAR